MRLGYNTNGLAHHRLTDAIDLIAAEGFQSVAITLDVGALDPYEEPGVLTRQLAAVRSCLDRRGLTRVVETGARYLLNPRLKHDPTLMDADPRRRAIRADFLCRAIDIARALDAECVSLWSGQIKDAIPQEQAMDRLAHALQPVLRHAEVAGMPLAFEPEPGMFIDTFARFDQLDRQVSHPLFHLTVDLGHVHCIEEGSIADHLFRWAPRILNLHIEDMVRGVHEHLMFGAGTMDFGLPRSRSVEARDTFALA
ncbi:MAG: sugar phosphate isomerase/epimerase family protein, partial [Isosphaeraceae bacterium]